MAMASGFTSIGGLGSRILDLGLRFRAKVHARDLQRARYLRIQFAHKLRLMD